MTKTAHHSLLFRLWIKLRGLIAALIILTGIIIGLISLILPNDKLYKQYIVDFLSDQWGKKVEIESISGKWSGYGPYFKIKKFVIPDKDGIIVQDASINVNLIKYLIPGGSTGISLGVNDIEIDIERKDSGKIVLKEKQKDKESFSDILEKLLTTGTLQVDNLSLNIYDSISNRNNRVNSRITVQQTENKRAFALELDSKDVAKSITIKAIAENQYDFMKQASWYVDVNKLSLSQLGKIINKSYLPHAFAQAQVWFSTKDGNIANLVGKAELKNEMFSDKSEITGILELVYKGDKKDWKAELSIKNIKTESITQDKIIINIQRKASFIYLNADVLDISLLKAITQVLNITNDEFDGLDIKGKLSNVAIKYDINLRRIVDTDIQFQQLDVAAVFGAFSSLSGAISFHDEQIRLMIDSDNGSVVLPNYIRGGVNWDKFLFTAQTSMHDDDIDIVINSLWCDCQDFIIDGAARVAYDEQLWLDLTFAVYQAKVTQLYKYWPSSVWKPNILNFLDKALVAGVVEKGMIMYHGLVKQYPFVDKQGVFFTKSDLQHATIKYHDDWPVVSEFNAIVGTINRQLLINSNKGQVLGAQIKHVKAGIENFSLPILTVEVEAQGQDNYLIDFLKQSPMRKGLGILNQDILLVGQQDINVKLDIPLAQPDIKVEPKGEINFKQTDFQMGQFQLEKLNGLIDFEGFSLNLKDLQSKFLNREVEVSGEILNHPNKATTIDILLNGRYNIKDFESILDFKLPAQGASPWTFSISNKNNNDTRFTAKSDLFGSQIQVPEPFNKTEQQKTPFSIGCLLPCTDGKWDMTFDDKLKTNFKFDLASNEFQLDKMVFGVSEDKFGGQIDVVDVDKWIGIITNKSHKGESNTNNLPFDSMSLHIDKVIFMARELLNVDVVVINNEEDIQFVINGDKIKGSIIVANDIDQKGIIIQLEKLHWQALDIEMIEQSSEGVSSDYPALHVWIGDFIYDDIPLGVTSIEVRPVSEGIRVEKFTTQSELMSLNINGTWFRDRGKNGLSQFDIIMTSKNIAEFLSELGFEVPISQADTIIDLQAQWHDFPSQFEIKNVNGKMRIEIGEGDVIDAKPGIGRVLGLFSLTNLPRRLILDFKDVFGKGLHFESMQGDFNIKNGEAYTDSFVIDSSSAKISVSGKTGLAGQDYDQTVVVVPRVGRIIPTIGAITGGAIGAAAGFFVQGMFRKGLKKVGKIVYKVTGSWDEPNIELIETEEL